MWLKCKRCGYIWYYKGLRSRATCPKCQTSVSVVKSIVDESLVPEELKRKNRRVNMRVVIVKCPICGRSFMYMLDSCINEVDLVVDLSYKDLNGVSFKEHVVECVLNNCV